jgi:hypothetical protein
MQKWAMNVGDILKFIADMLHPVGFEAAKANDWAMIRDKLGPATVGV